MNIYFLVWQVRKPGFTAKEIFNIDNSDRFPVARELGFANICFGLVGLVSFCKPEWRVVSAFASGVYFAFTALLHTVRKPSGANEIFALCTDLIIFGVLFTYFITTIYFFFMKLIAICGSARRRGNSRIKD